MSNETHYISAERLSELEHELVELSIDQRGAIAERIAIARGYGDLSENSEYENAKNEQAFNEGRIQQLNNLIRTAVVRQAPVSDEKVTVGSQVAVESDYGAETFDIVGRFEVDIGLGRISDISPVGRALIGSRVGDEVAVPAPGGATLYRVIGIS